jgi:hypothetical protein
MAFFVNRQITKGMHSESVDSAGGQTGLIGTSRDMLGIGRDMLGIDRDMLGIGRDMLGIGRDMLGIGRDMLCIGRDMLGSRTCRNNNPHRGRQYLHLWG